MVDELFRWYEKTKLPIYNPGDAAKGVKGEIPSNASESVLCHISVARWCYEHKKENGNKEHSERCGQAFSVQRVPRRTPPTSPISSFFVCGFHPQRPARETGRQNDLKNRALVSFRLRLRILIIGIILRPISQDHIGVPVALIHFHVTQDLELILQNFHLLQQSILKLQ